jgi:DNA (cytosine-5)-methyltransferase 1
MISLNRGEWSELYSVLFLIVKPELVISDNNLEIISYDIFKLESIIIESKIPLKYSIVEGNVLIYLNKNFFNSISIKEIKNYRDKLLEKILNFKADSGSFEIPEIDEFLIKFSDNQILKGNSENKSDVTFEIFDNQLNRKVILNYSVKSSLGSPATILNASNHTNFKYKLLNISKDIVNEINQIETRTKLLDRIKKINEYNIKIKFENVVSESFGYNLDLIDSNLKNYLANMLLYSYTVNEKDLKKAFIDSNNFVDEIFGIKKLSDFIEAISFRMMPSKKWNGINQISGGLIIIKKDGEVVILDLVYYSEYLRKYIIENTKLDSPSTKRYNMLNIYEENGEYYFTLNLQVRYKN